MRWAAPGAVAVERQARVEAEQKQMERDQSALGLTDSMACGEEVQLEAWEIYEAKAEEAGYGA